tara:strand:- start:72 stop:425 length:354 start_codon:yes stop_codon:yes gene_type:complete
VQTIRFFIVSKESSGVELLTPTEITLTVTCGPISTTVVAPTILPVLTGTDYYLIKKADISYLLTTYFTNSNEASCPITSYGIVAISGGSVSDWTGIPCPTCTPALTDNIVKLITKVP